MWVVEYIIEDLMDFFLDLGFSPIDWLIQCCKLSLFLAQTGPGTLLLRQSYIPDEDGQASYIDAPKGMQCEMCH